jgi:hypothetical protein
VLSLIIFAVRLFILRRLQSSPAPNRRTDLYECTRKIGKGTVYSCR